MEVAMVEAVLVSSSKQLQKVKDVIKFENVRKSSRSTFNHNCYQMTVRLSNVNIVTVFSARMLIGQRSPTHLAII